TPRGGFSASCGGDTKKTGLCTVATVGSEGVAAGASTPGSSASFAVMGLGVLAAARIARRRNRSRRTS
ncbi:hypothetical protein, partial [Salmonella enterica]|uniref:hypothetical protein n=1 Tax=Salmonella enterica TaxID=28901 RepID=UPI0019D65B1E